MPAKQPDLDDFDYAILRVVQNDCAQSLSAIAGKVNSSTAAVQRRIRRMELLGVISSNIAVIDPSKVGKALTILVEVQVEHSHIEELDAIKRQLSGPEVQQCYYVTGETDFVLVLTVETMEAYQAFARKNFYENSGIKWFRTIVVMDRVKVGLSVPLD